MRDLTGRIAMLGALVALAVAGCNGAAPGSAKTTSAASTATSAAPRTASRAPATSAPRTAATPGVSTGTATAGTTTASTTASTASSSTAPTASASASASATTGTVAGIATSVLLRGTMPPDPAVGFTGLLFLVGERVVPGSMVTIGYQGATVAVLPAVFFSSQVIGVTVTFTLAGDYTFTAIAPDGSTSSVVSLNVPAPVAASSVLGPPAVHMVWPPSPDTTFAGTVWIMGDHFLPGATLVGNGPTGPFVAPLLFTNERTVGWVTATPIAGSYSLQVLNPTFATSTAVTITVGAPVAPAGTLPAPQLSYTTTSVAAPFVGCIRIFGKDFLPGSVVELEDTATGTKASVPLILVSSAEAWWTLVYPAPGSYTATLKNPDGQATGSWPFSVQ